MNLEPMLPGGATRVRATRPMRETWVLATGHYIVAVHLRDEDKSLEVDVGWRETRSVLVRLQ